jgi:hypothetical protein
MTVKLFISYACEDAPKAEGLKRDLEQAGYACWLDTSEILGGDEWVRSIAVGIEQADVCLSLVSDAAQQSKWVLKEFLFANQRNKPVIPLLLEAGELPLPMIDRQGVPLYRDYPAGFRKLLATLKKISQALPKATTPAPGQQRQRELATCINCSFGS